MSSLRVIKYFIKSSPVGELSDVLEDVSNIVGNVFLQHADIKQAMREYYEAHKLQVSVSDGTQAIVAQAGRQEPIVKGG